MSNNEAKFILSAYRPGGHDADDPAMANALAQAKADPALGAWFAREQAHDAAVAAKLREVAPPPGLREAILTGARMSGGRAQAAPVTTRRAWWAQPTWLGMAAAVALLLGGLGWWRLTPVPGATMEEFAVNYVHKGFMLPTHSADMAVLKAWLAEKHGPLPEALPAKFADLLALGCSKLDYKGHDVSLVCFERGGKEFHVFVARRTDLGAGEDSEAGVRFLDRGVGQLAAATWTDNKNRYVLVSDAGLAAVKSLL